MHDIKRGKVAIGQLMTAACTTLIWGSLLLVEARGRLSALVLNDDRLRARSWAQGLVEWSLAAAVLAFVGIAAWQLAGTAITDAINRTIVSLNKAGS